MLDALVYYVVSVLLHLKIHGVAIPKLILKKTMKWYILLLYIWYKCLLEGILKNCIEYQFFRSLFV